MPLNAYERTGTAANGKASLTVDEAAAQLDRQPSSWSGVLGQPATVTYAYRASAPSQMPSDTAGFSRFTTAQIHAAELSFAAWSDVAHIQFVRVGAGDSGEGAYSDYAAILLADYATGESGAAAFSYLPAAVGNQGFGSSQGDTWINISLAANRAPDNGTYGLETLTHELGHTIGLSHPSDYNGSPGGVGPTYQADATYFEDTREYSIMSYFASSNSGGRASIFAVAPQLDDIAAAQRLYGANYSTRPGDDVYGFHSNLATDGGDRPWYELTSPSDHFYAAIWDGGGTDTLDFSLYTQDQKIDLRQGCFSNVGGDVGNCVIAMGAVIENAIAGSGNDRLIGNDVANQLTGAGGNDTLDGGAGSDTARLSGAKADYVISANAYGWQILDARPGSPDGLDTVRNIEHLTFSDQTQALDNTILPDTTLQQAITLILRIAPTYDASVGSGSTTAPLEHWLAQQLHAGAIDLGAAIQGVIKAGADTASVAILSYEFFTGSAPTQAGMDYLDSPTGSNPNNLNSDYYQGFNLENRYINFAVNLGAAGAGAAIFSQGYGSLSLFDATKQAYTVIFGSAPSDAKTHALLDPQVSFGGVTMTRADYFAYLGLDGPGGLGTKAAAVGWLLAEAVKADLGTYAKSNDAYLSDVAIHGASFGVDIVGHYSQPSFAYFPIG